MELITASLVTVQLEQCGGAPQAHIRHLRIGCWVCDSAELKRRSGCYCFKRWDRWSERVEGTLEGYKPSK